MLQINLLPREILRKREKRDFIIFVGICGIVPVLICFFYFFSLAPENIRVKKKLELVQSQVRKYQPILKQISEMNQKSDQALLCLNSLKSIVNRQSYQPLILYEISKALPKGVWLKEIKKDKDTSLVEIKGTSLTQTLGVAKFIENLNHSSLFEEASFTNFSKQGIVGREVMEFNLKCRLSSSFIKEAVS